MSEAPKRRLLDEIGTSPTFVADGCVLTGDLETNGPIVVCGSVRGDVQRFSGGSTTTQGV